MTAIDTDIFAEGFWDKICDTELVAALGRALDDPDFDVRSSAVNFFTAATAQGALRCFHRTPILKPSQLNFDARYLT